LAWTGLHDLFYRVTHVGITHVCRRDCVHVYCIQTAKPIDRQVVNQGDSVKTTVLSHQKSRRNSDAVTI